MSYDLFYGMGLGICLCLIVKAARIVCGQRVRVGQLWVKCRGVLNLNVSIWRVTEIYKNEVRLKEIKPVNAFGPDCVETYFDREYWKKIR